MSDRRMLGFFWLFLSVCLLLVMRDIATWGLNTSGIANQELLGGALSMGDAVGGALTLGISVGLWKHPAVLAFCLETVQETRKVVWPTRDETRDHTVVVIVTSIAIAMMLWGFDLVFKRLFGIILNLGA